MDVTPEEIRELEPLQEYDPRTDKAVQALIAKAASIEFRGGLSFWQPIIKFWVTPTDEITVMAEARVPDRISGNIIPIASQRFYHPKEVQHIDPKELLLHFMERFVLHEFYESVWMEGEMACDPHR